MSLRSHALVGEGLGREKLMRGSKVLRKERHGFKAGGWRPLLIMLSPKDAR